MGEDPIDNMRDRMHRCRRLASSISDDRTIAALREIANEIEADIARLEEERRGRP